MSDEDRDDLLEQAADRFKQGDDDELESHEGDGGGKRRLLILLLPVLLLAGGGGFYYLGMASETTEETVQTEEIVEPPREKSIYFDLPDMLVNLNSVGPKPSFLKLRASLELDDAADTVLLRKLTPRIIDKFQVHMRELRINDLRTSAGIYRLQEELRAEINRAVSPVEVKQVLFRNILVQ